jgi:hypothetical protein
MAAALAARTDLDAMGASPTAARAVIKTSAPQDRQMFRHPALPKMPEQHM